MFISYNDSTIIDKEIIFFRCIDGVAEAAAWSSVLSFMMNYYPHKAAFLMSLSETILGVGYTIGILF